MQDIYSLGKAFVGRFILALMALALLLMVPPGAVTWAQTTQTITLRSGNGPLGSQDPANQFTLDGVTWQNAFIVAPDPAYHVIGGTQYINRNPDLSGPERTTTRYRTSFELPSGFRSPSLTVQVHADNVATIFLNGVQIGQQPFAEIFENFRDPAESFSTTDSTLFVAGTNLLEFEIYNFHGPTAFDYQAIVSFAAVRQVAIDIKPGDETNCFNNDGHGVIPVAILSSAPFDAATAVDPATVQLDGQALKAVGKSNKLLASVEDVNGDGLNDLMVQIEDTDGTYQAGDTTAVLTGSLYDGTPIQGVDTICIVP